MGQKKGKKNTKRKSSEEGKESEGDEVKTESYLGRGRSFQTE